MSETLGPTATVGKGYQSVIRWCDPTINIDAYIVQRTLGVGGDTAVAGDFMTNDTETAGLVDIAVNTDGNFLGILMGPVAPPDNYDLDDTIADGTTVNILRPTAGRTIVAAILDGTTTTTYNLEEGDWIQIYTPAGHVQKWIWADTTDSLDTFMLVVGQSAEVFVQSTTDDAVIAMWY